MGETEPVTDAEVVSEGPKTPPPPPRRAELKPSAAGDSFGVFDGPINEAPNARKKPSEPAGQARQAAKQRASGGKGQPKQQRPPEPPVDPQELRRKAHDQALQLVRAYEGFQLMQVRSRYEEVLVPASLDALCAHLKFSEQELGMWVEPLTDGIVENGVMLPWWIRFGMAVVITTRARHALLSKIELQYQTHQKRQAEAEANTPKT